MTDQYEASETDATVEYFADGFYMTDIVVVPDAFTLVFRFSDTSEHGLGIPLRHLIPLYYDISVGRTGYVTSHHGQLRIEESDDGRLVLDLNRWVGAHEEGDATIAKPGPRIAGSKEELLALLRDPIRDLFATLDEQDADLDAIKETYFSDREGYSYDRPFWRQLAATS